MATSYELHSIKDHEHNNRSFHVLQLFPLKEAIKREYHRHDYYEIIFFEKGGGEHIIDFQSQKIRDHSAHFVLPGQVHKLKRHQNSNGYALLFSEDAILESKDPGNNFIFDLPFYNQVFSNHTCFSKEDYADLSGILDKLIKEESGDPARSYSVPGAYLTLLLTLLNRICYRNDSAFEPGTRGKTSLLINFKRALERDYMKGFKPNDYASQLNLSTGHLNDLLKEAYNKTTGEMIHERIMLESKRLLFHSALSVNEVSYKLGFGDPAYFTRFFKKQESVTPREYRISSRKKSL